MSIYTWNWFDAVFWAAGLWFLAAVFTMSCALICSWIWKKLHNAGKN